VELPGSQIPWNQVGPGWVLATLSPTPEQGSETAKAPVALYLFDPAGGRYAITTISPPPPDGSGAVVYTPSLVDWSPDGRRALFEDVSLYGEHTAMTEVDLATGVKRNFVVDGKGSAWGAYSRPDGQTILVSNKWDYLERVDRNGVQQLTFPTDQLGAAGKFNGSFVQTPDGSQLVLGGDKGLVVVGNDGVIARQLPMPAPSTSCRAVRWWTSTEILAACVTPQQSTREPSSGEYP
jgi:hypothetical protein